MNSCALYIIVQFVHSGCQFIFYFSDNFINIILDFYIVNLIGCQVLSSYTSNHLSSSHSKPPRGTLHSVFDSIFILRITSSILFSTSDLLNLFILIPYLLSMHNLSPPWGVWGSNLPWGVGGVIHTGSHQPGYWLQPLYFASLL